MAEAFLAELFQASNFVLTSTEDDQKCFICLQEAGKVLPETGFSEHLLRLPCGHILGSGCIVAWLRKSNTCPLCRCEFFPAQPRPYLEHSDPEDLVLEDEEEDEEEEDEEEDERRQEEERRQQERERRQQDGQRKAYFRDACFDCCHELRQNTVVAELGSVIAMKILSLDPVNQRATFDNHKVEMVALALYLASSAIHRERSPGEICAAVNLKVDRAEGEIHIDSDKLRDFFISVYDCQEHFEDKDFFEVWDELWPISAFYEDDDDTIEFRRDLKARLSLCEKYSRRLRLTGSIQKLSEGIVSIIVAAGFHLLSGPSGGRYLPPEQVVAVSIYIASHLGGEPEPPGTIQFVMGYNVTDIQSTYRIVRKVCDENIGEYTWESLNVKLDWSSLDYAHLLWSNGCG